MECNLLFNCKRGKVNNLNNDRFSDNIQGVVGHDWTIDGDFIDLIVNLYHYIVSNFVLKIIGVYWDKALLLVLQ